MRSVQNAATDSNPAPQYFLVFVMDVKLETVRNVNESARLELQCNKIK